MDGSTWNSHVRKMTPEELAKLDAQIKTVEQLRDAQRDRRQAQQAIDHEDRRHGERRNHKEGPK